MEKAYESSSDVPACHSTNPPGIERAAEPDPRRASRERSCSLRFSPAALLPARASAANAEAEEAIPAPEGKLLLVITSARSLIFARERMISRIYDTRSRPGPATSCPLMTSSSYGSDGWKLTVVWVNNPSRLMEMDPFIGMRRVLSRLPQYLMKAILGELWAVAVVMG